MHEVPAQQTTRTGSAKSLTLAAMSLGYGVVQLDVTIVNTALNSIGMSLGGGISELQWIVSIYTITFAALILTAGALGDRFGAKNIFMGGFAIFTAAQHSDRGARPARCGCGDPGAEFARAPNSCLWQ